MVAFVAVAVASVAVAVAVGFCFCCCCCWLLLLLLLSLLLAVPVTVTAAIVWPLILLRCFYVYFDYFCLLSCFGDCKQLMQATKKKVYSSKTYSSQNN